MELTVIEFLAHKIGHIESREQGYIGQPRWLCLSEEKKQELLEKAEKMFNEWEERELWADRGRKDLMAGAKTIIVGKNDLT